MSMLFYDFFYLLIFIFFSILNRKVSSSELEALFFLDDYFPIVLPLFFQLPKQVGLFQ